MSKDIHTSPTPQTLAWPNRCHLSVPEALRFLAVNPRPSGGQERFNAEHLHQLAREIESVASTPTLATSKEINERQTWEHRRAKVLLAHLWRSYDAAGTSMGRSHQSVVLEAVMELLGWPVPDDLKELDAGSGAYIDKTRSYLSAKNAEQMGFTDVSFSAYMAGAEGQAT